MRTLRFRVLLASIVTMLAFITVLQTACKKDKTEPYVDTECVNVDCGEHGECFKGECGCDPGYEGFYCEKRSIDRYLGTWNALETVVMSNDTSTIGNQMAYNFHIVPDGNSVLTFKLAGLMDHPDDTIVVSLGVPATNDYANLGFRFRNYVSATASDLYMPGGGGWITTSGSIMDSMGYTRWYGLPGNDTFVLKENVQVLTQKVP